MEGHCPRFPSATPSLERSCGGWGYKEGQASFRPKIERTKWLYWGSNHLAPPPRPTVPAAYILSMS